MRISVENKATGLDVTLQKVSSSVIIQGRLDQLNASLTVNGFVAYVNSTGYFEVSAPVDDSDTDLPFIVTVAPLGDMFPAMYE